MATVNESRNTSNATSVKVGILTGDATLARVLESLCAEQGIETRLISEKLALSGAAQDEGVDVWLIDVRIVSGGEEGLLGQLLSQESAPSVLLLAGPAESGLAYAWIERGVADVLARPPQPAELAMRLRRAVESREVKVHLRTLEHELNERSRRSFTNRTIVSRSRAMQEVEQTLGRVAPMRSTVLVTGESGVGKELVARQIHFRSSRAEGPFIAINCAALPPHLIESDLFGHEKGAFTGAVSLRAGKFELANGGTLFLDEIGETAIGTQAKLLRVLEQQEFMRVGGTRPIRVDVRLVAATNADMEEMVGAGTFREDLYYRLKVVTLRVPPLRERREDIPELTRSVLARICRENHLKPRHFTDQALDALARYDWPGNVRDLQNSVESVVVSSANELLDVEDLPLGIREAVHTRSVLPGVLAGRSLRDIEAQAIRETLELVDGSRTRAAEMLGVGLRTLRRRINELELDQEIPARVGRPPSKS